MCAQKTPHVWGASFSILAEYVELAHKAGHYLSLAKVVWVWGIGKGPPVVGESVTKKSFLKET